MKKRYKKLAKDYLMELHKDLQFFESMRFDDTVKKDAVLHLDMIEYKYSNIEKTKQKIIEMQNFVNVWL